MRGRGDSITAAVASVLLVLSGTAAIAAAAERWWPACPAGEFDSRECLLLQDHLYDQMPPAVPWEPLGLAPELHALSLVLLATAVTSLALLVARPLPQRSIRAAICLAHAPVVTSMLLVAAATWASGREDRVVEAPFAAVLGWALGWMVLTLTAALAEGLHDRPRHWLLVVLAILVLASPFPQLMLAPAFVGYMSHDTAPWSDGGVAGVLLVLTGLVCAWGATRRVRSTEQRSGRELDVAHTIEALDRR